MSGRNMKQTTRGLEDTHLSEVQDYLKEHADSILRPDRPFSKYMRALRIYEMPQLYEKIPRDVVLLLCFQERPGSVNDVNAVLQKHGMDVLRSSGVQE